MPCNIGPKMLDGCSINIGDLMVAIILNFIEGVVLEIVVNKMVKFSH